MQNKRIYIKPVLESETFVPQNYIAACGDTEYGKYLFECDAPAGTLYYYSFFGAIPLGDYHPCSKKHEAPMSDEFPDGFIDYNNNGKEDEGEAVKLWLERKWGVIIKNSHATKNLNQDSWTIVKS